MTSDFTQRRLWYWMTERHLIWERRQKGLPKPWTKDPVLQQYRFCNVFRELDTTTIWIRQHWREPYAQHKNLWFAMAVARLFNHVPTLAAIGFPERWEPVKVAKKLRARKEKGEKIFTSAYMLTGTLGGDKIGQVVDKVLTPLYKDKVQLDNRFERQSTLEDAFYQFNNRPGIGRFLAYEIVTDLRHTRYLRNAPDIMTWANAGPGAKRGLNRYFGRPVETPIGAISALEEMRFLLDIAPEHLPEKFPKLELRDIEHSLCEYDKYMRAFTGEGRPKQKYDGAL